MHISVFAAGAAFALAQLANVSQDPQLSLNRQPVPRLTSAQRLGLAKSLLGPSRKVEGVTDFLELSIRKPVADGGHLFVRHNPNGTIGTINGMLNEVTGKKMVVTAFVKVAVPNKPHMAMFYVRCDSDQQYKTRVFEQSNPSNGQTQEHPNAKGTKVISTVFIPTKAGTHAFQIEGLSSTDYRFHGVEVVVVD